MRSVKQLPAGRPGTAGPTDSGRSTAGSASLHPPTADEHFDDEYYARIDGAPTQVIAPRGPEPPVDVVHAWEWREAQRLRSTHRCTDGEPARCEHCRQAWPCTGITVADLAETRARGGALPPAWLTWIEDAKGDPPDTRVVGQAYPHRPRVDE